jgi:hypothetical protein
VLRSRNIAMPPTLELSTGVATEDDVAEIAVLRTAVADDLTGRYGGATGRRASRKRACCAGSRRRACW